MALEWANVHGNYCNLCLVRHILRNGRKIKLDGTLLTGIQLVMNPKLYLQINKTHIYNLFQVVLVLDSPRTCITEFIPPSEIALTILYSIPSRNGTSLIRFDSMNIGLLLLTL